MLGGTIVCGVGDGAAADDVADLGAALAARLRHRLVLVHVVDDVPAAALESVTGRQRQAGAARMLAALAREVRSGAETRLVLGRTAGHALATVAAEEGADLIVVGSRAAGFRGRALRSATARELESETPLPVLVAPPATRKRGHSRLGIAPVEVAR